jgi:DNA-binding NarL/FixJ family response regulator
MYNLVTHLDARQIAVMRRLAQGECPPAIAGALGLHLRTVRERCAELRAQLALPDHAALVAYARQWYSDPPQGV